MRLHVVDRTRRLPLVVASSAGVLTAAALVAVVLGSTPEPASVEPGPSAPAVRDRLDELSSVPTIAPVPVPPDALGPSGPCPGPGDGVLQARPWPSAPPTAPAPPGGPPPGPPAPRGQQLICPAQ